MIKMNIKYDDEMKNERGHKDNRVDEFRLPLEKRERWVHKNVGLGNLASYSGAEAPTPVEYYSSVL